MRVSVPGIPQALLALKPSKPPPTPDEAITKLVAFIQRGNVTVLTGAGVSVDSGIRAYRGHDGRYMNPNYKPIFFHELIDDTEVGHAFRQRYWLRSYLGYPPVRDALPNTTHNALAALQHTHYVTSLVTQNVDGLHQKALRQAGGQWGPVYLQQSILELHGTLHQVRCKDGHTIDRLTFQDQLSQANPKWKHYADELERTSTQPRTNPDGDVAIEHLSVSYNDFVVPECQMCLLEGRHNSVLRPGVTFFGESILNSIKHKSFQNVENSDGLLIMGTTLATYSAFRILKHAIDLKKPVLMLNVGPTRADALPIDKLDIPSGEVMTDVVRSILGPAHHDSVVENLLSGGVVRPPPRDTS